MPRASGMRCRGSAAVRYAVCVPGGALVLAVAAAAILHQARSVRGEEDPSTLLFVDERNNYVISTAEGGTVLMDGVNMTEQSMLVQMLLNENAALKKRMGALESAIKDMGTKYVKVTTTTTATTVTATTTTTIRQPNYEGLVGMKFSQASGEFEPGAGVRSHDESCQGRTYWASPSTNGKTKPSDEWLMFESTEVTLPEISRLDIYPVDNDDSPKNCKLYSSDDKLNWVEATAFEIKGHHTDDFNAVGYTCKEDQWKSFEFNPRKNKFWRLWMADNQGNPNNIAFLEVRFWGKSVAALQAQDKTHTAAIAKEATDRKAGAAGAAVSKAECLAAARTTLPQGKTMGRTSLVSGSWSWVPPGCSAKTTGDYAAHFNANSGGNNDGSYSPICATTAPITTNKGKAAHRQLKVSGNFQGKAYVLPPRYATTWALS